MDPIGWDICPIKGARKKFGDVAPKEPRVLTQRLWEETRGDDWQLEDGSGLMTEPDLSGETFWMLLTLIALPPAEAMAHFALDTPNRDDPRCKRHSLNPLGQLDRALIEYFSGWWEEFEPNCTAAEQLEALCRAMGETSSASPPGPFCIEEFIYGESWRKARELAQAALQEANMTPWPLPKKIDFSEYIEIADPPESAPVPSRRPTHDS